MGYIYDADHMVATGSTATIPDPAYELVRRLVEAATYDLSPEQRTGVLTRILQDLLDRDFRVLASRPQVVHAALRVRGQVLVMRLLKENREYVGTAATVRERFSIANSRLYHAKDNGSVIAFRPHDDGEFLFPIEQFAPNTIEPWASEIVRAVKNGAPAICFLYVRRRQMGWRSFADGLRDPKKKEATVQKVLNATQLHLADWG